MLANAVIFRDPNQRRMTNSKNSQSSHNMTSPSKDSVEIIVPPSPYTDRRVEPRFKAHGKAYMVLTEDSDVVACLVIDQSLTGAKIQFSALKKAPQTLWLIDDKSPIVRQGSPAWISRVQMGLKFSLIQELSINGPCPPKVPQFVFETWLKIKNQPASITQTKPKPQEAKATDDAFYFD